MTDGHVLEPSDSGLSLLLTGHVPLSILSHYSEDMYKLHSNSSTNVCFLLFVHLLGNNLLQTTCFYITFSPSFIAKILLRFTKSQVMWSVLMIKIEYSVFLEVHLIADRPVIVNK